jgi:hypothetical protein
MTRIAKLGEGVLLLLTHCRVDCEAAAEGGVPRGGQSSGYGEGARSQRAHGQRSRVT